LGGGGCSVMWVFFFKTCNPSENEKIKEDRQPDNPSSCCTHIHPKVSTSSSV